jgi:DNA-binding MarR family transcriptional regulator
MSQLERNPDGLKMGELSRRMMVTGGNVTGITTALVAEGLIERREILGDRRAQLVRLTAAGKRAFDAMAVEHERWVKEMVGGLTAADRERLRALLGKLKTTMQGRDPNPADGSAAKGGRK